MPVTQEQFKAAFGLIAAADTSTEDAVEAIARQQALVEGLAHTDPFSDLAGVYSSAKALVDKLSGMDDEVVQSHLAKLSDKLPPLKRLLDNLSKDDSKLPEGRQLIRKAMLDGDLVAKATNKAFKRKVDAWLRSLDDEVSLEVREDIIGLFSEDKVVSTELLDAALKRTTSSELPRDTVTEMDTFEALPTFRRSQILDRYRETPELKAAREKKEDMAKGDRFLSSEYRTINPLLAAFEALGVDPKVHRSPDYRYNSIESKLLVEWRKIAGERGADDEITGSWDTAKLAETYEFVRAMARVWDDFTVPEIPGNTVTRGDTGRFMYAAYAFLDPSKNGLSDGVHNVSHTITWPGMMSTTVGDPKQHNFITAKTFIWKFTVKDGHPGREIGSINPSEQEVTFPVGATVSVKKLVVRVNDKSLMASDFGQNAEVIAIAELS